MAVKKEVRNLTEGEKLIFDRMMLKIHVKSNRNRLKSSLMEAKRRLDKVGFSIPPNMIDFQTPLGWCAKAVNVPAKRIRPDGFTIPVMTQLLDDVEYILTDNYFQVVERMAIASALEHSVSFVFTTPGDVDAGEPEVIVAARTALEATAEVDARTNRVTAALEIVNVSTEALLYLPGIVLTVERIGGVWKVTEEYTYQHKRVLCVPYVWERSLKRPFGHSRITRPLIGFTFSGVRTLLRQESHAEFFSRPQRSLLGASEAHFKDVNGNDIDPLSILTGAVWGIPDVLNPETDEMVRAKLEQLSQSSMQPHNEMIRGIASQVSSETGIPLYYLGITSDQPPSADAIRASESEMLAIIESQFPSLGLARTDIARNVAAVLEDEWTPEMAKSLRGLQARFLDPGTPTVAAKADAALKFSTTFPDSDPEVAMEMYGMDESQILRMMNYKNRIAGTQKLAAMVAAARAKTAPAEPDAAAPVAAVAPPAGD